MHVKAQVLKTQSLVAPAASQSKVPATSTERAGETTPLQQPVAFEASAKARELVDRSAGGPVGHSTGAAARLLQRAQLASGVAPAPEASNAGRAATLENAADAAEKGGLSKKALGELLSALPGPSDAESTALWSKVGDPTRQRIADAMDRLAAVYPDAVIRGQLLSHERSSVSPDQARRIIASRTVHVDYAAASLRLAEAQFSQNAAAIKEVAGALTAEFGDRDYGIMPWVRSLR